MRLAAYGLAVEGWFVVLASAALGAWLVAGPQPVWAVVPAALLLFALLKFRDSPRGVAADPLGVISPVDGRVVAVARDGEYWRVALSVAMFSTYLLRSPVEGKVLETGLERGRHGMRIRTDEDEEVVLRLHGWSWLPPASALDYGERVGQAQRYGLLRSARSAELWLPADAEVLVAEGDRVTAGETILAHFHRNGAQRRLA